MIGRLEGVLVDKQPPQLLLDVQGVGYEVSAPMSTFYHLPQLGQRAVLHTHMAVAETSQQLFGFHSLSDRHLFKQLIKVNGVGPKMALAIMSGMETHEFVQAVRGNRVSALTRLPGVGKKTAERLVIEMRDRLEPVAPGAGAQAPAGLTDDKVAEAESALVALGYKPVEAARAITAVLKDGEAASREELIRRALKSMMPAARS